MQKCCRIHKNQLIIEFINSLRGWPDYSKFANSRSGPPTHRNMQYMNAFDYIFSSLLSMPFVHIQCGGHHTHLMWLLYLVRDSF